MTQHLAPGAVFAGYRIERVIGSGGMGTVYLAAHPRLPRYEALKVLAVPADAGADYRARFVREAELVAGLDHPNIVAVRDRGIEHGYPWIAMQFVDGTDAGELIRRSPGAIPAPTAVHIVTEAARGLDAAHRAGILHRDVKPANLLVEPGYGGPDRVYVTDFGIAKTAAGNTVLTEAGAVLATIAYAAPEQLSGGRIDQRADVYALGCTLYELLTGAKPFPRPTVAAVMHAHLSDPPPRVSERNPALGRAIDAVIARALSKDPEHRYRRCEDLAAAAAMALGSRHAAPQPAARPRTPLPKTWRRRALVAGSIAAVVVVAGVTALVRNAADSPGTSAGTSPPQSTTPLASPLTWGNYDYVAQAFPGLLPADPASSGYQGMRCAPVNEDLREVDQKAPLEKATRMSCQGNGNPLDTLLVTCSTSRIPMSLPRIADAVVVGREQWERSSGRGLLEWADSTDLQGQAQGILQVQFDDPARNFCTLYLWGGANGQDLVDRWWRDAPL
ncbi:serine/threonine-protein kinase [Nocardia sp. NPDC127526]|uniref:serine/threonine-protein kinase n=1 Tax=Nocardia sp. NPDC127526 TaxID=3345393 RepID=UPI00363FC8C7